MFVNELPTRRIGIRNGVRLQSHDDIQITLSYGEDNRHWLQVKGDNLHASTRSSIFIFPDNGELIVKYLEKVCGEIRSLSQSSLSVLEKQDVLIYMLKHMASIDHFKSIH